jgi:hypothetical protein
MVRQISLAVGCLILALFSGCAETTVLSDVPANVTLADTSYVLGQPIDVVPGDLEPAETVALEARSLEETALDLGAPCQPGEGCFMEPCATDADCLSGWCVDHQGISVCTQLCFDSCPEGWNCQEAIPTIPDSGWICISATANLCRPCHDSDDCSAGSTGSECLTYGPLARVS